MTYRLLHKFASFLHTLLFKFVNFGETEAHERDKSVAYYLWRFPVLSETFIQREIVALRNCGLQVTVIATELGQDNTNDEHFQAFREETLYPNMVEKEARMRHLRYFFARKPLVSSYMLLYVVSQRYHHKKSLMFDIQTFRTAICLAGALRDLQINHVHRPWADKNAFVAGVASRLLGISFTAQARAYEIYAKPYKDSIGERLAAADLIITNCNYNQRYLNTILRPTAAPIYTIYEGIDLQQFDPHDNGVNKDNRFRILTVARLVEQKGLIYLLEACGRLRDEGYEFICRIIGGPGHGEDAQYCDVLMELHSRLRLQGLVEFMGAQPNTVVLNAYRENDLFVLPCVVAADDSLDITPNVLIEAMAMKLPVISTDLAGIPEMVEAGVNGLLVPPNDVAALTVTIIRVIKSSELRKKLGQNARCTAREKFDINRNIRQYKRRFMEAHRRIQNVAS